MYKSDAQASNEDHDHRGVVYVAQANVDLGQIAPLGIYNTFEEAQAVAWAYVKEVERPIDDVDVFEVKIGERPARAPGAVIGKRVWYWHEESKQGIFVGDAEQRFQQ
ncbi:MAG: hypothetical protein EBV86_12625 [Marivivens sp.]|nr:hypothetical protein [Marivivens sp.]